MNNLEYIIRYHNIFARSYVMMKVRKLTTELELRFQADSEDESEAVCGHSQSFA